MQELITTATAAPAGAPTGRGGPQVIEGLPQTVVLEIDGVELGETVLKPFFKKHVQPLIRER